ncbi:MAG: pyridoxal phosphate-dependent aminotransferase [Patescibacteria group bacterium]
MQPATHVREIPKNPYRETRIRTGTLRYDLTSEAYRSLPITFRREATELIPGLSPARVVGDPAVRALVAEEYQNGISGDHIALVPGAKYGLRVILEAIVNPGDSVLVPDPGYPVYNHLVHLCRGVPKPYPLVHENHFQISRSTLRSLIEPNTRCMIVNSPHLPTGTICTRRTLEDIAAIACEYDLAVISDEVLKTLSASEVPSIATLPGMRERTVMVESISKRFFLAEWRVGWLVLPPTLIEPVWYILANGAPLATEAQAVLATLLAWERKGDSWVWKFRETLAKKRHEAFTALSMIPSFFCVEPSAGNWLFPRVSQRLQSSIFIQQLMEHKIGVLPGGIFGAGGKEHIAISCAMKEELLAQSMIALESACRIINPA